MSAARTVSLGAFSSLICCNLLFAAVLALGLVPCGQALPESLYVSVRVNTTPPDGTVVLLIAGQVTELNQSLVSLASVYIRVTDPYGSSVHVAFVHSGSDGSYSDVFQLSSDRPAGNYTIYVTASKLGFEDGYAKLVFPIGIAPLTVSIFPSSATVEQGDSAIFTIEIETRHTDSSPVSIEVFGLPTTFSFNLSSSVTVAPSTLTVQTSPQTSPGSYTFTVICVSTEGEAKASADIIVEKKALPGYLLSASVLIAALVGIFLYGLSRRRRGEKKGADDLASYPAQLEGLALSPSTLLTLPDHLRKTAAILCQLRESTAADIAARSGKTRAAESDYLNQLVRMGLVRKKRKGRESYFSVE